MVYSSTVPSFSRVFPVLTASRWFSADIFSGILQALTAFYYPAHAAREAAIALFQSVRPAPFDTCNRFPSSGAFATDFDPALSTLIVQLISALSYSDRQLNINRSGTPVTGNDPVYLAAKASYFNALAAFSNYVRDPANYYDQSKFETNFSLTWT